MVSEKVYALMMVAVIVSFIGFVVENVWLAATKGFMDNRGMVLPFLLGYGMAVTVLFILFGTPSNMHIPGDPVLLESKLTTPLVYFLIAMIFVSLAEILLGTFVERTCGFYWWDYTRLPLHMTRYTSIPTSLGFAAIIVLFMDKAFLSLYSFFLTWEYATLRDVATTFMILLIGDFLYNAYLMMKNKAVKVRWIIKTSNNCRFQVRHS